MLRARAFTDPLVRAVTRPYAKTAACSPASNRFTAEVVAAPSPAGEAGSLTGSGAAAPAAIVIRSACTARLAATCASIAASPGETSGTSASAAWAAAASA